ncbi:hypothetical protein [Flavobacterium sp.]|uniref:hypothetical protein n=1 Tax=Flavobacterium sp. TaxID=239 RepID=UPI002ED8034E
MSRNKKYLLAIYVIASSFLTIDCLLYYFQEISLRGYYSDVVLFWIWFILSFTVIVVFWKKLLAKLLLAGLIIALILSILPMMLPFFALVNSMTSLGLYQNRNLNENYRAQIVGYSPMAYPWLEVIEKKGIFEKRAFKCIDLEVMNDDSNMKIRTAKDIIFKNETDTTLTLTLFSGGPNKTITFNKYNGTIIATTEH